MSAMKPMTAYGVVHYLLRQAKGPARQHTCVDCGAAARHWAYDHLDAFERADAETGQTFSLNFAHYQPMCPPCHQRLDAPFDAYPHGAARCGTISGHEAHRRRQERPCSSCREAMRTYQRDYRARRAIAQVAS